MSLSMLDRCKLYSRNARSPYVGVPVVEDGSRRPAIFRRAHIQAATSCPDVRHATYDADAKRMIFNGGRACYALVDLGASGYAWDLRNALTRWANARRKSEATRALPRNLREDAKRRAEVAKLERRLGKLCLRRPENPVIPPGPDSHSRDYRYEAEHIRTWYAQRTTRRAFAKLYARFMGQGRKERSARGFPWGEVYAAAEAAGAPISGNNAYGKVRGRVAHKGIQVDEYMRKLWVFAGLERKPYHLRAADWYDSWEQKRANYVEARTAWLDASREAANLRAMIENLKPMALEAAEAAERTWEDRVQAYEAEGLTRSDAQAVVDAEDTKAGRGRGQ